MIAKKLTIIKSEQENILNGFIEKAWYSSAIDYVDLKEFHIFFVDFRIMNAFGST